MAQPPTPIIIKDKGLIPYAECWSAMRDFTDARDGHSSDELWLVEHPPVFTQGQAGKPEHVLISSEIPIVKTDRGGQVTFHGPGQLVVYPLLNLKRKGLGVRELVTMIENSVIACLGHFGVEATAKPDAPGVYVHGKKIASLGLRVRKGCSYHGVGLNIDMDLQPFQQINPCGYAGLEMTQISELIPATRGLFAQVKERYVASLLKALNCHVEM